jgi:ABC-type antimicrobial peptide transport system permease subunit
MRGGGTWDEVHFAGHSRRISTAIHQGTESFMDALGVSLVAGRMFTTQEARQHSRVAVISEDLVSQLGVPSPLGMRLIRGKNEYQVIGVAKAARYSRIDQTPPVAYFPVDYRTPSVTLVMRTTVPPLAILSGVRETVRDLDPNLPLVDIYTMEQQISRTLQRERLFAWLCGSFGVLALALCAVGIFGLMSHTTARRTPEIGIRIALGASRTAVTRQVFWDGMRLALAGMILGVPLSIYISSLAKAQKLLPEGSLPVPVIASAIALLTACAIVAVLVPALRASAVDPLRALRRT